MKFARLVGACSLLLACGGHGLKINYGVPAPRIAMPYGLVALDVELGTTKKARLEVTRASFFDRTVPLERGGVVVFQVPAGEWKIQISGFEDRAEVVRFGGIVQPQPGTARRKSWPSKPLVVAVKKNHLTNVGRLCVHAGCKIRWQAGEPAGIIAWINANRLVSYEGPKAAEKANPDPQPGEAR